jgi:hypothetical protein
MDSIGIESSRLFRLFKMQLHLSDTLKSNRVCLLKLAGMSGILKTRRRCLLAVHLILLAVCCKTFPTEAKKVGKNRIPR